MKILRNLEQVIPAIPKLDKNEPLTSDQHLAVLDFRDVKKRLGDIYKSNFEAFKFKHNKYMARFDTLTSLLNK